MLLYICICYVYVYIPYRPLYVSIPKCYVYYLCIIHEGESLPVTLSGISGGGVCPYVWEFFAGKGPCPAAMSLSVLLYNM